MRMIVRDARGKERGRSQDASENERLKSCLHNLTYSLPG